jgi:hypothetical protein
MGPAGTAVAPVILALGSAVRARLSHATAGPMGAEGAAAIAAEDTSARPADPISVHLSDIQTFLRAMGQLDPSMAQGHQLKTARRE